MQSTESSQQPAAPPPPNPLAPDHGRRVTKEEYWARWYENPYPNIDVSYESINGASCRPNPHPPAAAPQITVNLLNPIKSQFRQQPLRGQKDVLRMTSRINRFYQSQDPALQPSPSH